MHLRSLNQPRDANRRQAVEHLVRQRQRAVLPCRRLQEDACDEVLRALSSALSERILLVVDNVHDHLELFHG